MPKNEVKTSYQKVQLANSNLAKTKAAYGMRLPKKNPVAPLTEYLLENEGSGKTDEELTQEFRDECPHSFIVIASLAAAEGGKHTVHSCKRCFYTESTLGHRKPGLKKKEADGKEDSS